MTTAAPSLARSARSVRRAKTVAPRASETAIQKALVELIERTIHPNVVWTHIPNGELRAKATAAKLKDMGVKSGWPDLIFIRPDDVSSGTSVLALELKADRGRASDEQKAVHERLRSCGVEVAVCFGLDEAMAQLKAWGIIR